MKGLDQALSRRVCGITGEEKYLVSSGPKHALDLTAKAIRVVLHGPAPSEAVADRNVTR